MQKCEKSSGGKPQASRGVVDEIGESFNANSYDRSRLIGVYEYPPGPRGRALLGDRPARVNRKPTFLPPRIDEETTKAVERFRESGRRQERQVPGSQQRRGNNVRVV
jgi:hypothetical protein